MSANEVKKFYQKLTEDKNLQEKIYTFEKENIPKQSTHLTEEKRIEITKSFLIPLAHEEGFNFSIDDIIEFEKSFSNINEEISLDKMQSISAGDNQNQQVSGVVACYWLGVGFGSLTGKYYQNGNVFASTINALLHTNVCVLLGVGGAKGAGISRKNKKS